MIQSRPASEASSRSQPGWIGVLKDQIILDRLLGLSQYAGVLWLVVALSVGGPGCISEDTAGQGSVRFEAGGGMALQTGFPYNEGGAEFAFVDGWSLEFTKYVVVVGDIELSEPGSGAVRASYSGPVALDLKKDQGATQEVATLTDVPAKRLDVAFSFLRATAATENRNVDSADFELMVSQGWSYLIEGVASRDGSEVAFYFGLTLPTRYQDCVNGKDQTRGLAVEANKTIGVLIYAHAVHLFWDTLASGDEDLRFDAFAAVAGDDDLVTNDELAQQDLTDLQDADGNPLRDNDGHRVFYNDGGMLPPDSLTLETFVNYAARAGVHFNGVGLCLTERLD